MRSWRDSTILGVMLLVALLAGAWRIGYNMAGGEPENREGACTVFEDGSVRCRVAPSALLPEGGTLTGCPDFRAPCND